MNRYGYIILLFFIAVVPGDGLWAQSGPLAVDVQKDSLLVSARGSHFLSNREMEKLHNGLTVTVVIKIAVVMQGASDSKYQAQERFAFSFDLWEEKYSVFHSSPEGRFVSHLSASEAEEWCLKNMPVSLDVIPEQGAFVIQLECYIEENNRESNLEDAPGLTIPGLIEYFSRKKSEGPHYWEASTGLLRLNELKQKQTAP